MKRWIHASEEVVDFGNGHLKDQIVTYKGVKMPRKDADAIDYAKKELSYLSYAQANGRQLNDAEKADKEKFENQLRRYRDKYHISVGFYLPGGK